jgi:hypothetical protein
MLVINQQTQTKQKHKIEEKSAQGKPNAQFFC